MLRVSWRTVNGVVARVVAELAGKTDQLDGLKRIGIDEIAHRKGHRYFLSTHPVSPNRCHEGDGNHQAALSADGQAGRAAWMIVRR